LLARAADALENGAVMRQHRAFDFSSLGWNELILRSGNIEKDYVLDDLFFDEIDRRPPSGYSGRKDGTTKVWWRYWVWYPEWVTDLLESKLCLGIFRPWVQKLHRHLIDDLWPRTLVLENGRITGYPFTKDSEAHITFFVCQTSYVKNTRRGFNREGLAEARTIASNAAAKTLELFQRYKPTSDSLFRRLEELRDWS
jgi:hypothetical protein